MAIFTIGLLGPSVLITSARRGSGSSYAPSFAISQCVKPGYESPYPYPVTDGKKDYILKNN